MKFCLLECLFCRENGDVTGPARFLAPQLPGHAIESIPDYVPICADHAEGWYDDVPVQNHFPMIEVPDNLSAKSGA